MNPWRIALFLFLIQSSGPKPTPPQAAASINGTVVRAGSGEPIAGAVVQVSSMTTLRRQRVITTTGADGKFSFPDVEPASDYTILASHPSGLYAQARYGQLETGTSPPPLSLTTGQRLENVRLELAPAGAITGRVLDQRGRPVKDITVAALQPFYYEGRRALRSSRYRLPPVVAKTNKQGDYILEGLVPGPYYVAARILDTFPQNSSFLASTYCGEESTDAPTVLPGGIAGIAISHGLLLQRFTLLGPTPTYFPSTTNAEMALTVKVRAGERVKADIGAAAPPALRKVKGQVVDDKGRKIRSARVTLIPRGAVLDDRVGFCGVDADNGSFEIYAVAPGPYFLIATAGGKGPELAGQLPIDIDRSDIKDLVISARPRIDFKGRVTLEDEAVSNSPSLEGIQVHLVPQLPFTFPDGNATPQSQWSAPSGTTAADGSFTLQGVIPWNYRIALSGSLPEIYLKSGRLAGIDVLRGLHIESAPTGTLDVVVARDGGRIEGLVSRADGNSYPGVTAVLVPDAPDRDRGDLYKTARSDDSGRFHFEGIAPGTYKVFLWERVQDGAWRDAEFLLPYEDAARSVRVMARGRELIEFTR